MYICMYTSTYVLISFKHQGSCTPNFVVCYHTVINDLGFYELHN